MASSVKVTGKTEIAVAKGAGGIVTATFEEAVLEFPSMDDYRTFSGRLRRGHRQMVKTGSKSVELGKPVDRQAAAAKARAARGKGEKAPKAKSSKKKAAEADAKDEA